MAQPLTRKPNAVLTAALIWGGWVIVVLGVAFIVLAIALQVFLVVYWWPRSDPLVAFLNAIPVPVIGGLPAVGGLALRRWGLRRRAAEPLATTFT